MTADGRCDSTHCMTCSDEAIPMRVVRADAGGLAICLADDGGRVEVMTDLVGGVSWGQVVLVHAGVALALVEPPVDVP